MNAVNDVQDREKAMSIPFAPFKREDHIYSNPAFAEFLKDAVRAFNGSPVAPMPPPSFTGSGVYALYCTAVKGPYAKFGKEINRLEYKVPIYVGKAVPPGWRQSRQLDGTADKSTSLCSRLIQHSRSIEQGKGLKLSDFACRFLIFEGVSVAMIAAVEASLIGLYTPIWNSVVDGFGNHDPGAKRASGRKTQWDSIHPGRKWLKGMTGDSQDVKVIVKRIKDYMAGLR